MQVLVGVSGIRLISERGDRSTHPPFTDIYLPALLPVYPYPPARTHLPVPTCPYPSARTHIPVPTYLYPPARTHLPVATYLYLPTYPPIYPPAHPSVKPCGAPPPTHPSTDVSRITPSTNLCSGRESRRPRTVGRSTEHTFVDGVVRPSTRRNL